MLEKIINIKPDFHYKSKGVKNPYSDKYAELAGLNRNSYHDSIEFSPAAVFLSKINWKLKNKTSQSGEKLNLIFYIKDLEFSTEIDFVNFYNETRQSYKILKAAEFRNKKINIELTVTVKKEKISIENNIENVKIIALNKLFERILSLEMIGEIDKYESSALKDLKDGIEEEVIAEFDFINNAVFTLTNKLGKSKLIENFIFPAELSEKVTIEKFTAADERFN